VPHSPSRMRYRMPVGMSISWQSGRQGQVLSERQSGPPTMAWVGDAAGRRQPRCTDIRRAEKPGSMCRATLQHHDILAARKTLEAHTVVLAEPKNMVRRTISSMLQHHRAQDRSTASSNGRSDVVPKPWVLDCWVLDSFLMDSFALCSTARCRTSNVPLSCHVESLLLVRSSDARRRLNSSSSISPAANR